MIRLTQTPLEAKRGEWRYMSLNGPLSKKSKDFSIRLYKYYKWLTKEQHEYKLSDQLLRSGTSIGANVCEAIYAVSHADFVSKMHIAAKEAHETEYWLEVLSGVDLLPNEFADLKDNCCELSKMLTAALKTAKEKSEK